MREMLVSMYGTRPAAQSWHRCYTTYPWQLLQSDPRIGLHIVRHSEGGIDMIAHGDNLAVGR